MEDKKGQEWMWRFEKIYHRHPSRQEYKAAKAEGFPEIYVPGMVTHSIESVSEPMIEENETNNIPLKVLIIILLAILGYVVGFLYT
jgi:hypothetical protein